ncbi:MAG: Na+/H+ antiporter [Dysgonamonadaceae bacterium]|jgi:CPA1 family monovalent cation:H+ antiporter|nr:Na+/H+ antiporter [Dysgonamonadaceae bacterium]
MEAYAIIIILLAVAVGLSPVATKIKLPYPVLLLLAGIGVGFIHSFQPVSINPEVVFLIFLPPMLYDAACNISAKEFKRNLRVISQLAFFLVFVTVGAIAVTVHYCLGISWALSFVLGAILSPPDAIAATNVTKGLGLTHRTETILEGESLINDASALVSFRFAVAAVAGSVFVPLNAFLSFLAMLVGGFLAGWILSHLFLFIARKKFDRKVIVSLNLMLPFVAYLIAEEIHVSGVIAVVTAGLIMTRHKDRLSEATVMQSKSIFEMVIFVLSGLVFILIGLQFPQVLKNISPDRFLPLIGCSFLIFAVALLVRMFTVFWHKYNTKKQYNVLTEKIKDINDTKWQRTNRHFHNLKTFDYRIEYFKSLLLTWKEALIIGWSGMRGIVSLAAALSLPLAMTDGTDFPERDTILFLTVSVVIIMLLVQGLGLPMLVKWLKINNRQH